MDPAHDLGDLLFLLEDALRELFGRKMRDVLLGGGILPVEVAVVGEEVLGRDLPGLVVFLALLPPGEAAGEFLELDGGGLGVVLAAFGQGLLVVPDFLGGAGTVEKEEIGRDAGIGREHPVGQADDGVEVELLEKFLLDAGADAIAEQRAVGDDDGRARGASCGRGLALELAHDELQKQQSGLGGLLVLGEVALDAFFLFAAEGRIGEDDVHAVLFADFRQFVAEGVAGVDLRRIEAVQEQIHLAEQIGQRLGFTAEDGALLQDFPVGDGLDLLFKVLEGFDEEAAGAAGGIEDGFAEARVEDFHHEADDGAGGVELAGIAGGVAHFAQHGFVERAEGVELVAGGEMDAGDLVDDVAQEVAADHAVLDALEDRGDDVAAVVAVGTSEGAQILEQAGAALAVGADGFIVVDEADEVLAGDAVGLGGPIAPAIGRLDGGLELIAGELGCGLALDFEIVEELEEHDPGQHRQAVEVAVEALVLAHDVARGFEERAEGLRGGGGDFGLLGSGHGDQLSLA